MPRLLIKHVMMGLIIFTLIAIGEDAFGQAPDALPTLSQLEEGWNTLKPGGETRCAHGSEFEFYARAADFDRVLIYLYGGGACWDAESCARGSATYSSMISPRSHPSGLNGVLASDERNPFAGYTKMAVPVCTGDVHLGQNDASYTPTSTRGEPFTIYHRGMTNAFAAIDWLLEGIQPKEIVVAGSSAGSLAMPFYASIIARRFPDARVVGIGDDAGSYRRFISDSRSWGLPDAIQRQEGWEQFGDYPGVVGLFVHAAHLASNLRLYQIDHAYDRTQRFFLEQLGEQDPDVASLLQVNREAIQAELPHFRHFTLGGTRHVTLSQPQFYRYRTGTTSLRDWVEAVISGEEVEDITCTMCHRAEYVFDETDAALIEETLLVLAEESAWNPSDAGGACPAIAQSFSLRCAIVEAGRRRGVSVPATAAAWEIFYEALELGTPPRGADPVVAYNNAPGRTYDGVVALITAVRTRIMAETGD